MDNNGESREGSGMTFKEEEIYIWIVKYIRKKGERPTTRTISKGTGYHGHETLHRILKKIKKIGLLKTKVILLDEPITSLGNKLT